MISFRDALTQTSAAYTQTENKNDWNGELKGQWQEIKANGDWLGTAADKADDFLDRIDSVTTDLGQIAKELAEIMLAYGGIITAASRNLDEVMAQLFRAFQQMFYERTDPLKEVKIALLKTIASAALTYITEGATIAVLIDAVKSLADGVMNTAEPDGNIGGPKWRDLVTAYFVAQMKVLKQAQSEIDKLAAAGGPLDELARRVREMRPLNP